MTQTLTEEKQLSIAERSMLVKLKISSWSASKLDKKASAEIAKNHGSNEKMVRSSKKLIAKGSTLDKINTLDQNARVEHYRRTVPWDNNGIAILSSSGYFEYMQVFQDFRHEKNRLVEQFANEYPELMEKAKDSLGTLFNQEDYPHQGLIKNKFALEITVFPIPEAQALRVKNLSDDEVRAIEENLNKTNAEAYEGAVKHVMQRMYDRLELVSNKIRAYVVTSEGKENHFKDSIIGSTVELLDLIPSLNVTGSEEIERFANEMREKICVYSPADLRVSDMARERFVQSAEEILAKMTGYV